MHIHSLRLAEHRESVVARKTPRGPGGCSCCTVQHSVERLQQPREERLAFKYDVGLKCHARLKRTQFAKCVDRLAVEPDLDAIDWLFERKGYLSLARSTAIREMLSTFPPKLPKRW